MAAKVLVFENHTERAMMCANLSHDWDNQEKIFGNEEDKLLKTCVKLFRVAIRLEEGDEDKLLKKVYGIAKAHGVHIKWYGLANSCKPDRFLVSGRGVEELALIQC